MTLLLADHTCLKTLLLWHLRVWCHVSAVAAQVKFGNFVCGGRGDLSRSASLRRKLLSKKLLSRKLLSGKLLSSWVTIVALTWAMMS